MSPALSELIGEEFAGPMAPPAVPRDLIAYASKLRNPAGELAGQAYRPTPAQRLFLQAFAGGMFRNFALMCDTQSGKSWLLQIIIFHSTCEHKRDVIYGLQDMRAASDVWHKKVRAALVGSGLTHFLPQSGSGAGGGTEIDTVHLHNAGSILFSGAGGKNKGGGNDGRTVPIIINDELDTLPMTIVNKNERRADSYFRSARRLRASTIKSSAGSNIEATYNDSTQCRPWWRCVCCEQFTALDYDAGDRQQFSYDGTDDFTARESARVACRRCGVALTEEQRQQMINGEVREVGPEQTVDDTGTVIGPALRSERYGLRWTCFDNPFKGLGDLAVLHLSAVRQERVGRSQELIDFWQDQLVRPYPVTQSEDELDAVSLAQRSAAGTFSRGEAPAPALFTTAMVDQQKRLLLWLVKAHDAEGRTWRCQWGHQDICGPRDEPTAQQRMDALEKVKATLLAGLPRQDGGAIVTPVLIGVDVAEWPDLTAPWLRRQGRKWMAIHGSGADMVRRMRASEGKMLQHLPGWYDLRTQQAHGGEWQILWLDSDSVKHEVARAFARPVDGEGAAMLPRGLSANSALIEHLTAERWMKSTDGKGFAWVKIGRYNDWWDGDYVTEALGVYWLTEHPGWHPSDAEDVPQARHDDDDREAFEANLGGWK